MGYTDKLSIAVQMVPELLAGDVKQFLEQLLCDPAFVAELVAAGVVFAGLQATPAGPLIDAVMVATLGVDVALKLGGFLYKSYTASDENDLKAAAEDLRGGLKSSKSILKSSEHNPNHRDITECFRCCG
jgi:mannitol-specific phosphotransferase system IIBC component